MKRIYLAILTVATIAGLSACSSNDSSKDAANNESTTETTGTDATADATADDNAEVADVVFSGVLPGADVDAISYTLALDFNDQGNGGEYEMIQSYAVNNATDNADQETVTSEGNFTVVTKDGKQYLQFADPKAGDLFFLVENDSTITMVNAELQPAANPNMNYSLKAVK